jgi:hypothetical protein
MKSRKRLDENYWKILKSAYLGKQQNRTIPGWPAEVMTNIRGLKTEKAYQESFFVDRLVWRFASATCLLAIILSLLAAGLGLSPKQNWAQLLIGDLPGLTSGQFGLSPGEGGRG